MRLNRTPKRFIRNPIHFLALGFGSGLSPIAPGTCGTIAAIPLFLLLRLLPLSYYLSILAVMIVAGIWICHITSHHLKTHDHPGIVWDEIVGYLLTMTAAPLQWNWIIIGFILFRIFDIWKPWPIDWVDKKFRGGFGIVVDDLLAGIYAGIFLQFIIWSCN